MKAGFPVCRSNYLFKSLVPGFKPGFSLLVVLKKNRKNGFPVLQNKTGYLNLFRGSCYTPPIDLLRACRLIVSIFPAYRFRYA